MKSIVFFDHECPLCRKTINFLHRQDQRRRLHFASLEGKTAHHYLAGKNGHFRTLNTVVFLEIPSGCISIRGRAVFRILGRLGGFWSFFGWLYWIPFIDLIYRLIASHRKRGGALPPLKCNLLP